MEVSSVSREWIWCERHQFLHFHSRPQTAMVIELTHETVECRQCHDSSRSRCGPDFVPLGGGEIVAGSPFRRAGGGGPRTIDRRVVNRAGHRLLVRWWRHTEPRGKWDRGRAVIYNLAAVAVFLLAGLGLKLAGAALWPAILLHAAIAVWCLGWVRCRPA